MRASRRTRPERSTRGSESNDWFVLAGFGVILLASVMLVGGVHWYVACGLTGLGCLLTLTQFRNFAEDWNWVAAICALLALWTFLSIIPIPLRVLELVSQGNADLWSATSVSFAKLPPGWVTLSLDPIASTLEVAKWSMYACSAVVAGRIAKTFSLAHVLAIVWAIAVLVSFVTIFQSITQLSSVLGLYTPLNAGRARVASVLINPNNLAAFTNLGVFCGLGLAVSRRPLLPMTPIYSGVVICAVTTVLTASRGGTFALVLGIAALGLHWLVARFQSKHQGSRPRRTFLPLVGVIVIAGSIVGVGATAATWEDLLGNDLSKIQQLPQLTTAIQKHWLAGVGRGAFETVSFRYFEAGNNIVYRSVESFWLSWVVEWGLPTAVVALGSFAWLLRPARMMLRDSRSAQAAFVALIVLCAQNLVDLGLEVLSITVTGFAVFGALESRRNSQKTSSHQMSNSKVLVPLIAAAGLGAALLALARGPDVFTLRSQLAAWAQSPGIQNSKTKEIDARLQQEMLRRPAEPFFPILGASIALQRNEDALPWATAALTRAPESSRANLATAEALAQHRAYGQAGLHFRRAIEAEPTLLNEMASRIASLNLGADQLERIAPQGALGARFLLAVRGNLPLINASLKQQLLELATARAPDDHNVMATFGFTALEQLRINKANCLKANKNCTLLDPKLQKKVEVIANRLGENVTCDNLRIRSRLLSLKNLNEQAVDLLSDCNRCAVPVPCARERVDLAQQMNLPEKRRAAELSFLSLSCSSAEECAKSEFWLGDLAVKRKDWLSAYAHYLRSAGRLPARKAWLAAASAAATAGQNANAEIAYQRARTFGGRDPETERLLKAGRSKLLNPADGL